MCDRWAAANAPTVVKQKEKYPFIISGQDAIQKEGVNSGYGLLMTGAQKRGGEERGGGKPKHQLCPSFARLLKLHPKFPPGFTRTRITMLSIRMC